MFSIFNTFVFEDKEGNVSAVSEIHRKWRLHCYGITFIHEAGNSSAVISFYEVQATYLFCLAKLIIVMGI